MRRFSSTLITLLLIFLIFQLFEPAQAAWTSGSIYIKAGGNIEAADASITTRDKIMHTPTTDDINIAGGHSIVIEKDGLVLNWNRRTLAGPGEGAGIAPKNRENVAVRNFEKGISLSSSFSNKITENTILGSINGIAFYNSSNNIVCYNNYNNKFNQVESINSANFGDEDSCENYWSDYNGSSVNNNEIADTSLFLVIFDILSILLRLVMILPQLPMILLLLVILVVILVIILFRRKLALQRIDEMRKLLWENEQLKRELQTVLSQRAQLQQALNKLQLENEQLKGELERSRGLRWENEQLKRELQTVLSQRAQLQQALNELRLKNEQLQQALNKLQLENEQLKEIINPPRAQVVELYKELVEKVLRERDYVDTTILDKLLIEAQRSIERGDLSYARYLLEVVKSMLDDNEVLVRLRRLYQIGIKSSYTHAKL
ncbi:MAG: hypothetical protein QXT28_11295 [Thermofilaceae archaeon]